MDSVSNNSEQSIQHNSNAESGAASAALEVVINVLEDVQKVVSSGRPKALRVRLGDKIVAELPLAITAAAAFAAGLAAVMLTKLAIEVITEEE